jgi:hypothetical protein
MKKTSKSLLIVFVSTFFTIQMNAQVYFDPTAGGTTVRGNKNLGVNTDDPDAQIHLNSDCSTYKNPFRITKTNLSNSIFSKEGNLLLKWLNPGNTSQFQRGGIGTENLMPLNNLGEASMITEGGIDCNTLLHWDIDVRGIDNSFVIRNMEENISTTPSRFSNAKDVFDISPREANFYVPANIPTLTSNAITTSSLTLNGPFNGSFALKGDLKVQNANGDNVFAVYQNGEVRARKTKVDLLPIPDYVFKKEYKLMNLKELELYIEQNNHLPNIKSEAEYTQAGEIDLGELNLKLLEKVEELTLHLIEQNKKIEKLEAALNNLNK